MHKFCFRLCLSAALMAMPIFGAAHQSTTKTLAAPVLPSVDGQPLPCPPCFPTNDQ